MVNNSFLGWESFANHRGGEGLNMRTTVSHSDRIIQIMRTHNYTPEVIKVHPVTVQQCMSAYLCQRDNKIQTESVELAQSMGGAAINRILKPTPLPFRGEPPNH